MKGGDRNLARGYIRESLRFTILGVNPPLLKEREWIAWTYSRRRAYILYTPPGRMCLIEFRKSPAVVSYNSSCEKSNITVSESDDTIILVANDTSVSIAPIEEGELIWMLVRCYKVDKKYQPVFSIIMYRSVDRVIKGRQYSVFCI